MESLSSSRFLISPPYTKFPAATHPLHSKTSGANIRYFSSVVRSKKTSFQDFQEYAKPSRLLPAREVKVCTDSSVEKAFASFTSCRSQSLYRVKLQTSKIYGSGLTDANSGILLCLIDENGSSILQRLPATSVGSDAWSEDKVVYDTLHFQRGSVDEFAFEGPDLGRIVAVWVSVESGQWRIGGLSLTIISDHQSSSAEENQESKQLTGFQYNFEFEDVLLGEKSDAPMVEFRPRSVTAFSENESTLFDKTSLNALTPIGSYLASNEESMKEYGYLKFSLLFYDAILILAGSSLASISTGENALYAFLTGGLCGFFYLLLLQRSVDELTAPELIPSEKEEGFGQIFGRLKGPILGLVLASAFTIITLKYASGEDAVKLTPKDIMFGMMGFLMCKVAVVLAAFKPVPLSFGDNK